MDNLEPVQRRDYLHVGAFTFLLYVVVLAVGGPLTLHEGVLSQTTKAMLSNHDFLVPRYGNAPWLERPPLPQWISCVICTLIGHCDQEWNVRIGPALAGLATVLLTLWLAGRLYGRGIGILSALALATMYNFLRYSTLAEADIFLAPIVAAALCVFAYTEIRSEPEASANDGAKPSLTLQALIGSRPWAVLAFFVLLGMTNLVKGFVFGMIMALAPITVYVLWTCHWQRMAIFMGLLASAYIGKAFGLRATFCLAPLVLFTLGNIRLFARYCWLWGWLTVAAIALPWPLLVIGMGYDDALEVWWFDLFGRLNDNYLGQPIWYYFECLTWVTQPWLVAALVGMGVTWTKAWRGGSSADRFVWCWAWMPILIFSMSNGKHHHYMLHYLAPWAILAARGTAWMWAKLGERRALPRPAIAVVAGFACVFVIYSVGLAVKGQYFNRSLDDTAFLFDARRMVPSEDRLMIEPAEEALEGLRMQFYLGDKMYLLHNFSFVLDEQVGKSDVYVVTRYNRLQDLTKYGRAEKMLQCKHARRETSEADRWTLFRVHLRDDLPRKSASVRISPMQAMYRAEGPRLD